MQCLTNGVRNRNKLFNLQLHGWFANHKNIEVSQTPEQTVKLINYHAPVQHQHFFSKYVSKQIPSSDRRIEFDLQHSTIRCLKDLLIAQLVTSYSLLLWSDMLAMFTMFRMESSKLREVNYCSLLFVDRKCSVQNLAKHRLHVWVVSPWTVWLTAALHSVTCLLHAAHSQSHCSCCSLHKDAKPLCARGHGCSRFCMHLSHLRRRLTWTGCRSCIRTQGTRIAIWMTRSTSTLCMVAPTVSVFQVGGKVLWGVWSHTSKRKHRASPPRKVRVLH